MCVDCLKPARTRLRRLALHRRTSFTGAGAPPPARTDADASPRIRLSSAQHSRRRRTVVGTSRCASTVSSPLEQGCGALPSTDAHLSLALGPHPQRELTLMLRLGSACPRLSIAAGAGLLSGRHDVRRLSQARSNKAAAPCPPPTHIFHWRWGPTPSAN